MRTDNRSGTSGDIDGARVAATDGSVLDASGFAVSEQPVYETNIAVAPGVLGRLLVRQRRAEWV